MNSICVKSVLIYISWFSFILVTYKRLLAISFLIQYREPSEFFVLGNTFSSYFKIELFASILWKQRVTVFI